MRLIIHQNPDAKKKGINPFDHGPLHTEMWKTEGLKQALEEYQFDAAFGGARRDEEKSRAKERIFHSVPPSIVGIQKRSSLNFGHFTIFVKLKVKVCVFSHCRIGLNWTFGNIFISRALILYHFIFLLGDPPLSVMG